MRYRTWLIVVAVGAAAMFAASSTLADTTPCRPLNEEYCSGFIDLNPRAAPGVEIIALRDAVSRHYRNNNGHLTAEISPYPIHHRNSLGEWVPIGDMDVVEEAETFEYTYATGHCAYDGTEYGKTDMGLIKVEREITLYPPSTIDRVGWMKFDLSSIPDTATVTWVQCRFIVTYFEMSMSLAFTCLDMDPLPAGAQALYQAIWNSEVCAMGDMPRAVETWDLGTIAAAHIQQSLGRNWTAFGQVGYNYSNIVTKRGWIIGWNVSPREHAPRLLITYEPPPPSPTATSVTPTPSRTPIPTFTSIPTFPPIPTWTSAIPPTSTAFPPTHTPRPSPTHPDCSETGVRLDLSQAYYTPGDLFRLDAEVCNSGDEPIENHPLFVILDISGTFWFGPAWQKYPDFYYSHYPPGSTRISVIPAFSWPENAGSASGVCFWGALTNPDITGVTGTVDRVEFGYGL
ncbi:hypothetical protein JXA40_03725 [bacterium]|nr:hypothetical protein [candidate division CSSED10-310 bacterium]